MSSTVVIVQNPDEFRAACDEARSSRRRVGFVPTMGALHEGHLSLVDRARRDADFVAVSIFVNPTQFGPNEDFARYPRDLARDVALLAPRGASLVFAPDPSRMYLPGDATRVRVDSLTSTLCGPFRPGHFEGVATVVTKLLALAGPSVAVFGRKDYQQLAVIRRLVRDLFLPVTVVGHPIVREADGLAMSSRNAYLSAEERSRALALSRGLAGAARAFGSGERRAAALVDLVRAEVVPVADSIDYIEVVDDASLSEVPDGIITSDRALLAVACHIGRTRLIDNVILGEAEGES